MTETRDAYRYRLLILAPFGRDAELAASVMQRHDIRCHCCRSVAELVSALREGGGAALVAEEALGADGGLDILSDWVRQQPSWSDFPFIVLTGGGGSTPRTVKAYESLKQLGNVSLLERPARTATLSSAVRAALRARRRQYEVEAYIVQCERERMRAEAALAELQRSTAELQQFTYIASHDLREPLRTVNTFTQLLTRKYADTNDPEANELSGHILTSVRRMTDLLHDLLAFSWAGQNSARLNEPTSTEQVLQSVMRTLRVAIDESDANITHGALPPVWLHETHLAELLQNLISNAIKYRGADPPRITITAQEQGAHYRFAVRDNGIGIAPEYGERIFRLFQRLHGREIPGTGLGLAICKKIVETYAGQIWVESERGKGATFYFILPAAPQQSYVEPATTSVHAASD
jgi:signal transduction histidine kinase